MLFILLVAILYQFAPDCGSVWRDIVSAGWRGRRFRNEEKEEL